MSRLENKECLYCGMPLIMLDVNSERAEPYCATCEKEIVVPAIVAWKEKRRQEKLNGVKKVKLDPRKQKRFKIHPAQVKAAR